MNYKQEITSSRTERDTSLDSVSWTAIKIPEVQQNQESLELVCPLCNDVFKGYDTLRSHVAHFHMEEKAKFDNYKKQMELDKEKIEGSILICKICSKEVKGIDSLVKHQKEDHGIIVCRYCTRTFESNAALIRHKIDIHGAV